MLFLSRALEGSCCCLLHQTILSRFGHGGTYGDLRGKHGCVRDLRLHHNLVSIYKLVLQRGRERLFWRLHGEVSNRSIRRGHDMFDIDDCCKYSYVCAVHLQTAWRGHASLTQRRLQLSFKHTKGRIRLWVGYSPTWAPELGVI